MWQPRISKGAATKYLGLAAAIEEDIAVGLLQSGDRLPSQRQIAAALGIDLTTVTRAFEEAKTRGLLAARATRGGTVVSDKGPAQARQQQLPAVDLSLNIPPNSGAADLGNRIARTVAEILKAGSESLYYVPALGREVDRQAGCRLVWGDDGEQYLPVTGVCSGGQGALWAICATRFQRGDRIGCGSVTFPVMRDVARELGIELVGLSMDSEGVRPDALADACRDRPIHGVYLVPTIDNPTTATMSLDRRLAIIAIARRHGMMLIEDDPYRFLLPDGPPSLARLAPDLTFGIASLSKCTTPTLRIAYVTAPTPKALKRIGEVQRATVLMASPLMASVASRWISSGALALIVEAVRRESQERQALARRLIRNSAFQADPNGFHLWLTLPERWDSNEFVSAADSTGVSVMPGARFAVASSTPKAVRVALGSALDRTTLASGLRRLNELLSDRA